MARFGFAALLALSWPGVALGEVVSHTTFMLDLTHAKEALKKATWSDPDRITVTPEGLGWGNRDDQGSRDFWLQTEPIGIGLSWRPTSITSIKATVDHPGTSGMLYARYSADGKHWTTWQHLESADSAGTKGSIEMFQGTLRVPYRETARYHDLRLEYSRRDDVPWRSDEEALVKELVKRDPKFFENVHSLYRICAVPLRSPTARRTADEAARGGRGLVPQRETSSTKGRGHGEGT